MGGVFIIGLPTQISKTLEAAAKQEKVRITSVTAGIGKEGRFRLFPAPEDAIHSLRAYYDQFDGRYEDAFVVVLPYAPIPDEVRAELDVLESMGAEVVQAAPGEDDWPPLAKRGKPDTRFFNDLFRRLRDEIFEADEEMPSDYFRAASERNSKIIIAKGALDSCNDVPQHRHAFMKLAADTFVIIADRNGQVGRMDAFFRESGLDHAQSGGISTTLRVCKDGRCIHNATSNMHLKQGDNTTPQAAARIYYQHFLGSGLCYIVVFYAGPHPDCDLSLVAEIELP